MEKSKTLQISQINTGFVDVPGQISVNIFAQGCKLRCPGCQNPQLLPFEGGITITLEDLAEKLNKFELADWICWVGGDITYQDNVILFNKFLKHRGYKICIYTGQLIENIRYLLKDVDLVIDGPWKGIPITNKNTNQRIFLKRDNKWEQILNWEDLKSQLKSL